MAARRRPPPEARPPVRRGPPPTLCSLPSSSVLYSLRREGTCPRNPPAMESAYMREVQRRMESNHKSRLRLRERERMQAEEPREQRAAGGLPGPLTPTGRKHDGPWASGTTTGYKIDVTDTEGKELQRSPPYARAPVTGRGGKLPSIASATGKRLKVPEPSDTSDTRSSPATGSDRRPCFQTPVLPLKVPSGPPTPVPTTSPTPGGLCCGEWPPPWGEEDEEGERERERERERGLCRQQTEHILRQLRRERLRGSAMAGALAGANPSLPAAGHLPFSHRPRPWSGQEVDVAPAPAPATSSRGTQTPETGHLVTLLTPGPHRLRPLTDPRPAGGASAGTGAGGFLRPPLSLAVLAVSQLSGPEPGERGQEQPQGGQKPPADPEVLRKLQESLLEEEDDEEGDVCRICLVVGGCPVNPLLEPCRCVGSLQFVHHDCLKKWLQAKVMSGASLTAVTTCELCKHTLKLDFDNFDVHEFHRKQATSQVEEQMSNSSLYMAVLLHLYEQRFTELMRLLGGSNTGFQFPRADSQTGEDASDTQNSDSEEEAAQEEEEESGELRTHHTLSHRGRLLTFQSRDT